MKRPTIEWGTIFHWYLNCRFLYTSFSIILEELTQEIEFLLSKKVVILSSHPEAWEESRVVSSCLWIIPASNILSSESPSESHFPVANGPVLVYLDGSVARFGQESVATHPFSTHTDRDGSDENESMWHVWFAPLKGAFISLLQESNPKTHIVNKWN